MKTSSVYTPEECLLDKSTIFKSIGCGQLIPLACIALMFAAIVGGTSFAGATELNLRMVEQLVCPEGSMLSYRLGELETVEEFPSASSPIGGTTSGRSFSVRCVGNGEVLASGDGLLLRTLAAMLGGYFLACFIPLFIASSLTLYLIRAKLRSRNKTL
jgi:hypothetical protein